MSKTNLENILKVLSQSQVANYAGVTERTVRRWVSGETPIPEGVEEALGNALRPRPSQEKFTFIDLFAGIGGTRLGMEAAGGKCIYTSERDKFAQRTYLTNFGISEAHQFDEDITQVDVETIPDHDVLVAGFPCQPFSIAGVSKKNSLGRAHGFMDEAQGTLFFDVARILEAKKPKAFLLENVKNLVSHDKGNTFRVIIKTLTEDLGYHVFFKVVDASSWVPQKRKRIFIVGFKDDIDFNFEELSSPASSPVMADILHTEAETWNSEGEDSKYFQPEGGKVNDKYTLTDGLWNYLQNYADKHRAAGNGFGYGLVEPNDVARTLSARYYKDGSEVLVSQGKSANPRKITPREAARLMGFPDTYKIPVSDTQAYKQFGNTVVVPVVESISKLIAKTLEK